MARTLSSNILTQIQAEGIRVAHLLKLSTTTAITVTNHVKDLAFNDGDGSVTYQAGGNFLNISEVNESGTLEYYDLNIALNNVSTTVRDIFTAEDYINKDAKVFVAFLDTDETIIDAFEYFVGTITGANITEAKGDYSVDIEIASHFKNWNIVKGRRFTDGSHQEYLTRNSLGTDKGLEFAHQANKNVRWNR